MNRINKIFESKKEVLNIFFTAGFPEMHDTIRIAKALGNGGADMLEIGIPFSDPVADGPTIQHSSKCALDNGMTLKLLFDQLKELRNSVSIPVLLMGYVNPIIQFGMEEFCKRCSEIGIDGVIIPDLPMYEYESEYSEYFKKNNLHNIFLISPSTAEDRIREIDSKGSGFIYMVSSASITGAKVSVQEGQLAYYDRIQKMNLQNPKLIGFGISNKKTFKQACEFANGAIIGSAFIDQLNKDSTEVGIQNFIHSIKGT
jgi:tryptophan synthase alpha chain